MDIKTALETYRSIQKKLNAYGFATTAVYYDSVTAAPEGGEKERNDAMEILSNITYEIETSPEMLEAVQYLVLHKDELDAETKREIELYNKQSEYMKCIPQEEYVAYGVLVNEATSAWRRAKNNNDFAAFAPYLQKIFDTNKKFSLYYKPDKDPYDTLLDGYEKGLTKEKCDEFFSELRETIVPLVKKIVKTKQIDNSFMFRNYPIHIQHEFSDYIMEKMAIDKKYCAIGETEHPFTLNFNKHDVRITTHYYENDFASSMYSVVHEGGHALYELGSGDKYEGTGLSGGASMAMHETISRYYENIIGRSKTFISLIFPKVKELFHEQFSGVTEEDFYRAANYSEPSLIRTEADELTYTLHIMIRYEIECGMISGEYKAEDLPRVWAEKYRHYLGVEVPDDARGVLQDSHWSGGSVGYFPSYALGSAYGAQIFETMKKELDIDAAIRDTGDLSKINEWLEEHIFRHGAMYDSCDLLRMCTGEEFNAKYYTEYLKNKYSAIYGLE